MSYVFVEKEHSKKTAFDSSGSVVSMKFGITSLSYEDTPSLGSSNSDSDDIRCHTHTPTLVNSWIPCPEVRPLSYAGKSSPEHLGGVLQRHPDPPAVRLNHRTPTFSSTLMPHSGVLPMIEIPDSCVEYIGRLMTGEIIEATAIENENETKVHSINSPKKLAPRFFENTANSADTLRRSSHSSTRGSRTRFVVHIHLCECIAVFSCCIFT
jgi:hypothetical protein